MNPVDGATVEVLSMPGIVIVATAISDGAGLYSLSMAPGTYDIRVTPPAGSGFGVFTRANQTLLANSTVDIVLLSANAMTLSGHVRDGAGQGLANQRVEVMPSGGGASFFSAMTDAGGLYSLSVAAGSYRLSVSGSNPGFTSAAPGYYSLNVSTAFTLTASTEFDIQLPVYRVEVHAQDPGSTPVAGVGLAISMIGSSCGLTVPSPFGDLSACGMASYTYTPTMTMPGGITMPAYGVETNSSGNATLWLLPTPPPPPASQPTYTLTATPPAGSPYGTLTVGAVDVQSNKQLLIVLQGTHEPPHSIISTPDAVAADGTYPDPVHFTLSATATTGYSVTNIKYKVDGGAIQTFAAAFTVSGAGAHTVRYWAVDSGDVYEMEQIFSFVISGVIVPVSVMPAALPALTVGTTPPPLSFTATGGTWIGYTFAVTSGTLPAGMTLTAAGMLTGTPTMAGPYNFTITVTDSGLHTGSQAYVGTVAAGGTTLIARDDEYAMVQGTTLSVPAPGVLTNDTVPAGGASVEFLAPPTGLAAPPGGAGGFSFTPDSTFTGLTTLHYTVHSPDGDSNIATVRITVTPTVPTPDGLSGRVTDGMAPIAGALVEALTPLTSVVVAMSSSDASGHYQLSIAPGTYDVRVTPPSGSGLAVALLQSRAVGSSTTIDVVLVSAGAVSLSGRVLDGLGQGMPSVNIQLTPVGGGGSTSVIPDAAGTYSASISPGTYTLNVNNTAPSPSGATAASFNLSLSAFSVTNSAVLDIALPFQKVDVRVQDLGGNPIADVALSTMGPANTCTSYPTTAFGVLTACGFSSYYVMPGSLGTANRTNSAGTATLWLFRTPPPVDPPPPVATTYTITAVPPAGGPFGGASVTSAVDGPTSVTITLVPSITVSGRVLDGLGQGMPSVNIQLTPVGGGGSTSVIPDAAGTYSASISPGTYTLNVNNTAPSPSGATAASFNLSLSAFSVTNSAVLDIALPFQKVDVRVQDLGGNPIADVALSTMGPANTCTSYPTTAFGVLTACGFSSYYVMPGSLGTANRTNSAGTATLWLFPTPPPVTPPPPTPTTYTITAIPPTGSPFAQFGATDVAVTGPKSVVFVLQFVHDTPVTTIAISPSPDANGKYPDPVTVTLSGAASSGFSIGSTSYSIAGEPAQTYIGPFSVAGGGGHSIRYWSVDNTGVYEIARTLTFEIVSDHVPPVTQALGLPAPNGQGWNNALVHVSLSATDNDGGTGVREIVYASSGAQVSAETTTAGGVVQFDVTTDGTTVVSYYARDNVGNQEAPKSLTIKIDKTPPVITLPASIAREATSAAGSTVDYLVSATDPLDSAVRATCSPASRSVFALGATTVACTATDAAGNIASGSFTVTVRDSAAPVLTLPANLTLEATSAAGATATFSASALDGISGPAIVTCAPASGAVFPIAITTVSCSATDVAGNTATGSFTVTVKDSTAPAIGSVLPNPATLWPPNHQMVAVQVAVAATDSVTAQPVCRVSQVSSNEPINGAGDGDTAPDWVLHGGLSVELRAERAGGGSDRIYTLTVTCQDKAGNAATKAVTVSVPKNQGKK